MKDVVIEVGQVDREKTIYHFDFEPEIGRHHLPAKKFEGNNLDDVFRYLVNEVNMNRDLRDNYILGSVGRFG